MLERKNILLDSYFLYDRGNFVKTSFISELHKFISIYGQLSYFAKKKKKKKHKSLISPTNTVKFEIEKNCFKDSLNCKLKKLSEQGADILDLKKL